MIKINTSGDYVQLIYVDPVQESVQQELKSDTDAFECSYDSEGKLYLQFGLMRFENPDPTDFIVNDVAVTDAADFISKLNALFTGGGGGGATIYTGDGSIPTGVERNILLEPNSLFHIEDDLSFWLRLENIDGQQLVQLTAPNDDNTGFAELTLTGNSDDGFKFDLQATDGVHPLVQIIGYADPNSISYTADTHTFTGIVNLPTQAAPSAPEDGWIWREDNTNTGLKIRINGVTKTITVS